MDEPPTTGPLTVAWITDFPIEWLPELPESLCHLPRGHPMTWQQVLLAEFTSNPRLRLHVIVLRKSIRADVRFEHAGAIFHVLKVPAGLRTPSLFWVDTLRVRGALREIRPVLVHAWGTERGAALVASRLRLPILVTMQGLLRWYGEQVPLNLHDRFMALLEPPSLRRARRVTTESRFAVDFLRRCYPQASVHQVEHAPSHLFHEVHRRPQTQPLRFLSVGTIGQRKGTDLLLRALAQLPAEFPFEVVLTGAADDPFLAGLRRELSAGFWRRVTFKGQLRPIEVAAEMAVATMLLMPTRADTSPNAVKESVVAGLPVIASRVGGIPDYVLDGQNGLLFPPDDLTAFTRTLLAACQHPIFSRGCVEPATLARSREYLSPTRMAASFWNIYEGLATESATHRTDP